MSRTQKRGGTSSPITKYISFSGSTGKINYYDKESSKNVEMDSLSLIVLDTRASISGFSESHQGGISSNLVKDTTKDSMKVIAFKNGKPSDIAEGIYKDIKDKVKDKGGKFTTNVIAMADLGDGMQMVNVQLSGAALSSWIDFTKENPNEAFYDNVVELTAGVLSKRGADGNVPVTEKEEKELDAKLKKNPRAPRPVWFYVLDVTLGEELTVEQSEMANEQDEMLQEYFGQSAPKSSTETSQEEGEEADREDDGEDTPDDLPF